VDRDVSVYAAFDARASSIPDWLGGWSNTGQTLESTDGVLKLYAKDFAAGPITLGGNRAAGSAGSESNYTVIIAASDVNITVTDPATLASITVGPVTVDVLPGDLVQFTASGRDQHGAAFLINPTWEISGGGIIDQSGLLAVGTSGAGPFTVTATQGLFSGKATVSMAPQLVLSDLTVASGRGYQVLAGLKVGDLVYTDRSYTYTEVPVTIQGETYLRTANVDKNRTETAFLTFSVNRDVTVYVAYDSRATSLPAWLAGWNNTGSSLNDTDVLLNVYAQDFAAGPITLGANMATGAAGADSNYAVAIVPM
jgi:hypothetical protein